MEAKISAALTIKYEDVGQGSPVVLLHAFPLCRAMWQPQIDAISKEYRVLAPDLRGFGGTSAFEGTPSIEQMADDIVALLDALNIQEPVALAGLSMGGYVALALARKYPQRLRALILADTRAEPDTAEGKAKRDEMIQLAESKGALAVAEQMAPNLLTAAT
ncbi:MAG: alpha/beta fold hydrolase, partial [Abitibacteriaceae bacterium]|nr:alpha/beta fold hydrolase [Abditibacteriaceae bacterium]